MKICRECKKKISLFEFAHSIETSPGKEEIFCRECGKKYKNKKCQEFIEDPSKDLAREVAEIKMPGDTYRVMIPIGMELIFPQKCVCCGEPATTEMLHYYEHQYGVVGLVRTEKQGYAVPYCSTCECYHNRKSNSFNYGIAAFFICCFYVYGLWEWFITGEIKNIGGGLFFLAWTILIIFLLYKALWPVYALRTKKYSKCGEKPPIGYVWSDTNPPGASFIFSNQEYANEFASINGLLVEKVK